MSDSIKIRIERLREQMKNVGVHAYYISGTDPHQSEYLPTYWQSRPFISGFTGSAGLVVVTMEKAALWTDSRYFIQAEQELKGSGMELMKQRMPETPEPAQWLADNLSSGSIVGTDYACLSGAQFQQLKNDLGTNGLSIKNTGDLLGKFWEDRPALPKAEIFEHELQFAGTKRSDKIEEVLNFAEKNGANSTLLTALDDIAWTFNLRGKDVSYNPVFVSYGFVSKGLNILFVDPEKVPSELRPQLQEDEIELRDYHDFFDFLSSLSDDFVVMLDPQKTNQAALEILPSSTKVVEQTSGPALLKAQKSTFEIIHIRETMKKDGVAMVEFLYWLDQSLGKATFTEYDVVEKLNYFRSKQRDFQGDSFYPIVGLNENGAIVHRSVTREAAADIKAEGMLLVDSGGQYLGGTTDITRTIALSEPTERQKHDFTLVLKGMIDLSMVQFPAGTVGCQLDSFARMPLWKNHLDYGHGTGHGIGYFLNVHEGPMSIRKEFNEHTIKPGMVISNEPGLYKEGEYGIRVENVIVCMEKDETDFGRFMEFETLTLCPIDLRLIEPSLLSSDELKWLNDYHQRVFDELSPMMDDELKEFLRKQTQKID